MAPFAHGVELPADFDVVEGRRGLLAVRRSARAALAAGGLGADGGEVLATTDLEGRHPLGGFVHAGTRYAVRTFRHGGLLRFVTGRRFADPRRPFRELVLAEALHAHGIATPRVVGARSVRAWPGGWHLSLVTERVEGTCDLAAVLARVRAGEGGAPLRHALFRACGELVGRLHRVGFLHADLHPKNILVEEGLRSGVPPTLWILDLDRSRLLTRLTDDARRANLRRLHRSLRRAEARGRRWIGPGDLCRFLAAYGAARGTAATPAWRQDWRAIAAVDARRGPWHRLGWILEGLFAGR